MAGCSVAPSLVCYLCVADWHCLGDRVSWYEEDGCDDGGHGVYLLLLLYNLNYKENTIISIVSECGSYTREPIRSWCCIVGSGAPMKSFLGAISISIYNYKNEEDKFQYLLRWSSIYLLDQYCAFFESAYFLISRDFTQHACLCGMIYAASWAYIKWRLCLVPQSFTTILDFVT